MYTDKNLNCTIFVFFFMKSNKLSSQVNQIVDILSVFDDRHMNIIVQNKQKG
jgi:hypothetical protein